MTSATRLIPVLLAGLLASGVVQAADIKIGFIDTSKLLAQSPQAARVNEEMNKKFGARAKDLAAEQEKLKGMQDQLSKNGAVMSTAQVQDLQSQFDDLQRDFSRKSSEYQEDVNMEKSAQLSKLQQAVIKATQEFAQTQKYNMIIADVAVYHDSTVDVTEQVLAQMQKDFKADSSAGASGN